MTTLYIFVDESGNPTRDDYYVVAGCWCVSHASSPSTVVDPTVQRLRTIAENVFTSRNTVTELKGASFPTEVLTAVVQSVDDIWYDDSTIPHPRLPWDPAYPGRFSIAQSNPEVANSALSSVVGNQLNAPETMKLLLLISVLDPLFRPELLDYSQIDSVEVVLDAEVWDVPAAHASDAFEAVNEQPAETSFTTASSKQIPGLQLADLGAYSWARHHRKGDCEVVLNSLDKYRFVTE